MFFIHGGAFVSGAGSIPLYDGSNLVDTANAKMVYVSINYRLGVFGFLSSEQLVTEDPNYLSYGGANGIQDQITVLL